MAPQDQTGGTVLIVDDEPDLRLSVVEYFSIHGLSVFEAEGGGDMRRLMATEKIDVVLLDLRLRGEDGFDLCRELRQGPAVGIIMLTGSTDTIDKVVGLELGADDYVGKPFELRELLARVRGLQRRVGDARRSEVDPNASPAAAPLPAGVETRRFGQFTLNLSTQSLHAADGQPIPLTGPVTELFRSFDLVFCHKGETSWHRNQPRSSAQKQCG